MEVYIEKEFLDKFHYNLYNTSYSRGNFILANILKNYGDLNVYIDSEINTAEKLAISDTYFVDLFSQEFSPISILKSIKQHFFENSKCEQTLIFTIDQEDWFDEVEKKGAICFCYENFERKLESIISICENLKVDLNEPFVGWNYFKQLKIIPKNKIIINDGYLFAENSGNNPVDENLIPFLKNIINPNSEIKVDIYTNYLNTKPPKPPINIEKIKGKLNNVFRGNYELSFEYIQGHFHDRILYSNFFLIGCGVGFNFNKSKKSNSIITVDSIFDKFNYKRMNNHLQDLKKQKANSVIS